MAGLCEGLLEMACCEIIFCFKEKEIKCIDRDIDEDKHEHFIGFHLTREISFNEKCHIYTITKTLVV